MHRARLEKSVLVTMIAPLLPIRKKVNISFTIKHNSGYIPSVKTAANDAGVFKLGPKKGSSKNEEKKRFKTYDL